MFAEIMWIVVTVSALIVYYDASKNKIGSIPGEKGFTNADAGIWATTTLLLWIIAFPIYLLNRSQLIEKAKLNPREPSKWRNVIFVILSIFVLFSFINLAKDQESEVPVKVHREISRTNEQNYVEANVVQFCKGVDDNLQCINPGSRFKVGTVYAKIEQSKPFNTNYLYVKIYVIKGASESLFDKGSYEVNPEWGTFAIPIPFNYSGKYKVVFRKIGDEKIAEGIVTIY